MIFHPLRAVLVGIENVEDISDGGAVAFRHGVQIAADVVICRFRRGHDDILGPGGVIEGDDEAVAHAVRPAGEARHCHRRPTRAHAFAACHIARLRRWNLWRLRHDIAVDATGEQAEGGDGKAAAAKSVEKTTAEKTKVGKAMVESAAAVRMPLGCRLSPAWLFRAFADFRTLAGGCFRLRRKKTAIHVPSMVHLIFRGPALTGRGSARLDRGSRGRGKS